MIRERSRDPDQADQKREDKAHPLAPPNEHQPEGLKREEPSEEKRASPNGQAHAPGDPFGEVFDGVGKGEGQACERSSYRPGPEALRGHERRADIQTG